MVFYCPNCQKEYEVTPTETQTTLSGRVANKAVCPACGQMMVEFAPATAASEQTPTPTAKAPTLKPADKQGGQTETIRPTRPLPEPGINPLRTQGNDEPSVDEAQDLLNKAVQTLSQSPQTSPQTLPATPNPDKEPLG